MGFRVAMLKLHRWAGLTLALMLVALGGSGALMVLEGKLLPSSFVGEQLYHVPVGEQRVPIQSVLDELHRQYEVRPQQVSLRGEEGRPDEYRFSQRRTAFVDPFTGEILGESGDFRTAFSRTLWDFHASLLLGEPGRWIIGVTTAVLGLSLLAGLVIGGYSIHRIGWRAVSLRWMSNGDAWNRRFHNLMGFIWSPVLLLITLTGCFIAFEPIERATLGALGAPQPPAAELQQSAAAGEDRGESISADSVLQISGALQDHPDFETLRLHLPRTAEDFYRIQITGARERAEVFVDPMSGERLEDPYASQRAERDTLRWFIRSFHYGTVLGYPTEMLWLFGCLMLPVFVVSGLLLWLHKTRKRPVPKVNTMPPGTTAPAQTDWVARNS